jgi:hypothetical protein
VPMQPIDRLADLGQRAEGGVDWACPQCGRYLVRYPDTQLVLAAGAAGLTHILGPGYDDPTEVSTISDFDQQFLDSHAMAWCANPRPPGPAAAQGCRSTDRKSRRHRRRGPAHERR